MVLKQRPCQLADSSHLHDRIEKRLLGRVPDRTVCTQPFLEHPPQHGHVVVNVAAGSSSANSATGSLNLTVPSRPV